MLSNNCQFKLDYRASKLKLWSMHSWTMWTAVLNDQVAMFHKICKIHSIIWDNLGKIKKNLGICMYCEYWVAAPPEAAEFNKKVVEK